MKYSRLKAAVIGCGNIGGLYDSVKSKGIYTHAHAYTHSSNTELIACCDTNKNNLKIFKNLWGKDITSYTNLTQMLQEEKLDIVSIATPTQLHYSVLKEIIKNTGIKYIICEKPFVASLKELDKIKKLLKNSDANVIINYMRCFDPTINKIKKLIENNKLGGILSFNAQFNKGIYHNGSHIFSLVEHLIAPISRISTIDTEIIDNDIYGNFNINTNVSNGIISNFHETNFAFLQIEIILEQGVISIKDSGFNITVYKSKKSKKFNNINQLQAIGPYQNTFSHYALNTLNYLLSKHTHKYFNLQLDLSRKLLILHSALLKGKKEIKF